MTSLVLLFASLLAAAETGYQPEAQARQNYAIPSFALRVGMHALCAGIEGPEDEQADERPTVLVVVGAEGSPEYGAQFRRWAERWREAAERGEARYAAIGLEPGDGADRELLRRRLAEEAHASGDAFWLVLIGHGTFDGRSAKFNLRGPDVSASELAEWLKPFERPLAVVNCASSSGPFINVLSGANRVIVTATKSGHERNFAHFGDYLSAAIAAPEADLDKDDQTSLLEAFLLASARLREFYAQDGRLATEHPLVDDNGDGLGTPAEWFHGVRAVKAAKDGAALDGLRAGQLQLVAGGSERQLPPEARARRDELERGIAELRQRKGKMPEDEYYDRLEPLLVELSRLYEQFDKRPIAAPESVP